MKNTSKSQKKPQEQQGHAVLVGMGLAAVAAAAAGTYFLYGSKDAAKHRKQVKGWALKAKGEILEKIEAVTDLDEEKYHKIVGEVTERYEKLKNVDLTEMANLKAELKTYWKNIRNEIKGAIAASTAKTKSQALKAKPKKA